METYEKIGKINKLKSLAFLIFKKDPYMFGLWLRGLTRIEDKVLNLRNLEALKGLSIEKEYNKEYIMDELTRLIKFYNDSSVRTDSIYYVIKDFLVDIRFELHINDRIDAWYVKNYRILR